MELLNILFKVNFILALFYCVYRFALRKLTFYNFNRFYLLSSIFIAIAIPLIPYNKTAQSKIIHWQEMTGLQDNITFLNLNKVNNIQLSDIALSIYWSGVIVMSMLFIIQFYSLILLFLRSKKSNAMGYDIRSIPEQLNPFSFFQSIFINPQQHTSTDLQSILQHEAVHVKQWHSVDVILGEIKRIFCWFNPIAWLMLSAIRENLEFIADRKVLQTGIDKKMYQYALLNSEVQNNNTLSNHFNFSHLKMRITMMNKTKTSDMHLMKYLLAVPVLTVAILFGNISNAQEIKKEKVTMQNAKTIVNGKTMTLQAFLNASREELESKHGIQKDDPLNIVVQDTLTDQLDEEIRNALNKKLNINNEPNNISSIGVSNFTNEDIDSLNDFTFPALQKVENNNNITKSTVTTETGPNGNYQTGFKTEVNNVQYLSIGADPAIPGNTLLKSNALSTSFPKGAEKIYLDGEQIEESLNINDPNKIQSIFLLGGKEAQNVIPSLKKNESIIWIKSKVASTEKPREYKFVRTPKNPIIIVDGVQTDKKINEFETDKDIEMIVLKGKKAKEVYPNIEEGQDVIQIKTKKASNNTYIVSKVNLGNIYDVYPNPSSNNWTVKIKSDAIDNSYILYDIKGKMVSSGKLLKTTQIKSQGLLPGTYTLEMKIDGTRYGTHLVLEK